MKMTSESEVTQSCPTLCDPMDWSLPGFSVHGIFQARVLEWVAKIMPMCPCVLLVIYLTNRIFVRDGIQSAGERSTGVTGKDLSPF